MTRAIRYPGTDGLDVVVRADRVVALADLGDGTTRVECDDGTSEVVCRSLSEVAQALGWVIAEPPAVRLRD